MRALLVYGFGVRLVGAANREQGERGDDQRGALESAQFVQGQRGLADGEGVAADEGERVVAVQNNGPRSRAADPGLLAEEGDPAAAL